MEELSNYPMIFLQHPPPPPKKTNAPPPENDWERLLPDNFLFSIALKLAQNKNKLHKALDY